MPHEKVEIEEYQRVVRVGHTVLALVSGLDTLPEVLAAIGRAEALGPFVDPTLFIQKSKAMAEDKELLEALLPIYRIAQRLKRALPETNTPTWTCSCGAANTGPNTDPCRVCKKSIERQPGDDG